MTFGSVVLAVIVGVFVALGLAVAGTVAILYTLQRAFWANETRISPRDR